MDALTEIGAVADGQLNGQELDPRVLADDAGGELIGCVAHILHLSGRAVGPQASPHAPGCLQTRTSSPPASIEPSPRIPRSRLPDPPSVAAGWMRDPWSASRSPLCRAPRVE